ncbi:MAG TPA: sigma-70 family RNA polymerase sigma factor [Verrucomicrobiae bacterium]
MPELDDIALLKQFAETDSEPAFAGIVSRHLNHVYSTALRSAGDPHAAQEISQAVFIILARKAKSLGAKTILSGWLHRTARLTAANYLRGEIRRQKREQETFMQSTLNETADEAWRQIAPLLDDAISKLGAKDRDAIVLRFFENKSLGEVGAALGASEDAAKMRVNRALEKLRKFFAKRGATFSAAIIASAVSANSVQAAPAGLAKTISAVAIAKGAAAGGSTLALVKGALKIMAWTKVKTTVFAGVVLILAAGTTTVIVKNYGHHPRVKLQWTPAEKDLFRQESIARMNQSKQWALACIMFAADHQNQLPKNFEQLKPYVRGNGLSSSNWEFVSGGNLHGFANVSKTILFREKELRPSPGGKFAKVYAFADGHVEVISSLDGDFAALERQRGFLVQPAK